MHHRRRIGGAHRFFSGRPTFVARIFDEVGGIVEVIPVAVTSERAAHGLQPIVWGRSSPEECLELCFEFSSCYRLSQVQGGERFVARTAVQSRDGHRNIIERVGGVGTVRGVALPDLRQACSVRHPAIGAAASARERVLVLLAQARNMFFVEAALAFDAAQGLGGERRE